MKGSRQDAQTGGILSSLIALLFFAVFCFTIYLARYPLMRTAASWWMVEDSLDPSDALIVLSDDNFYADRATRAAELFREGKAPLVVASGRRLRPNAGIAELMEHDLVERGVPKDRIVRFPQDADTTLAEAEALRKLAKQRSWRRLIVVTSNYHTRRARYIFQNAFPQGMEIRIASARDGDFDPERWWEKRKSIKRLAGEWLGYVVAVWELHGPNHRDQSTQATQFLVGGPAGKVPSLV